MICLEKGETKKRAAFAISFTLAGLPNGVIADQVFSYSASSFVLSVNVAPGAIVLTVILYCDSSVTRFYASISIPAFVML